MISTHTTGRLQLALFTCIAFAATPVHAQTAPSAHAASAASTESSKDVILLNPFEVSTSKDQGYAAGNTLSGGRADTPLAITPASISVMTQQFLEDFNITDMNLAAQWTVGMDAATGGENGPFGGNRFQANFRNAGNGANYPSRDGSLQYFVADSYNTERFEFSRGPNAALFGDAGPGGVQSSSSKRARYNNVRTTVSANVDSFDGYRTTLDTNYGVGKFGVRVNALRQEVKAYQDGTGNKQKGISVAMSFKIEANTDLRLEYERSTERQLQYRRTYNENASLWDRVTVNNNNTDFGNGNVYGLERVSQTNDYIVWNFGTNSLLNYKGAQYRSRGLGYAIPWQGRLDIPGFKPGVSKRFNLGPGDINFDRDFDYRAIFLEHRFTSHIFAQLAYLNHDIDPVTRSSQNTPNDYRIDVNKLLPTGATNPNFGKAYSDFSQNTQYQQNGVKEYRFIGNYRFDILEAFDLKQNFVLNAGYRKDLYEAWTRAWRWSNNPLQPDFTQGVNTLNYRVYWDQPRPSIVPVLPPDVPGMTFKNVDTGFQANNDRRLTYGQVVSQTSFWNEKLGLLLSVRRDKAEDNVFGNIGFDPVTYSILMGAQNPVTLKNEVGRHGRLTTYQTSKNGGIVAYPFPQRFVWLAPLGFVVNYSQNFSIPSTGANLINGQRPSPPVATTRDFGLRYAMPHGRVYLTVTHYNTKQVNNIISFGNLGDSNDGNPGFRNIWRNLGYTESELAGDNFNYRDTNSRKLEGWEGEITANPTKNITFTANYSHPIVTTISDSPGRRAYYAAHLDEFKAGAAAVSGTVLNGHTVLNPAVIAQGIQNIENSLNGFFPGTLANGTERHRINIAGSYRFTDGMFKNLAFNSGLNYRGDKKIGARDPNIKFNTATPTVAQNAAAAYDYLWTGPTVTVSAGANYTHRFGKVSVRFQLNISNLLNEDTPMWTSYSTINAGQLQNIQGVPAGSPTVAGGNPRMQVKSGFNNFDPRKYTFTTSFTF